MKTGSLKRRLINFLALLVLSFCLVILFFFLDTGLKTRKAALAGKNLLSIVLNNQPKKFSSAYKTWQEDYSSLSKRILFINQLSGGSWEQKYDLKKNLDLIDRLTVLLPDLLAEKSEKTYFVLLQNNFELRPSGGFLGSYAKLKFKQGVLADLLIQDIYVPDGQIGGHVDPPWPIQEAFKTGFWKLRDANWDPDFPTAAQTIDWFFQKGKEEKAAGLIAVNLLTVKKLLKVIGAIYLPDYQLWVNEENFYQVTQSYAETNFFPGSTQKANILSALGSAFFEKFKNLSFGQMKAVAKIVDKDLNQRQILLSFTDPVLANFFQGLGWDGSMAKVELATDQISDYLYLVETNLGANKANCCVDRKVTQTVDLDSSGTMKERLQIDYQYQSGFTKEILPVFPASAYQNFLRLYLPESAQLTQIKVAGDPLKLTEKNLIDDKEQLGLKGYGFFVTVAPLSQKTVEVDYEFKNLPSPLPSQYHLIIQKQPGIESFPYVINLSKDGRKILYQEKLIQQDETITLNLMYNETTRGE